MAQGTATQVSQGTGATTGNQKDAAESLIRTVDESTKQALFLSGNKQAGIFVGLWPPTFQALKSVADTNKREEQKNR